MPIIRLNDQTKTRVFLFILFVFNVLWFSSFKFHTFMGDDLSAWNNFKNYQHSFWHYVFLQTGGEKYRPVFNLLQYGQFCCRSRKLSVRFSTTLT